MRFESQLSRRNCQMFSCGLSSGHLAGIGMSVMLEGHDEPARKMPSGLIDEERRRVRRRDLSGDFGEVQVLGLVSHRGMMSAAPLPCFGQIAPKM